MKLSEAIQLIGYQYDSRSSSR